MSDDLVKQGVGRFETTIRGMHPCKNGSWVVYREHAARIEALTAERDAAYDRAVDDAIKVAQVKALAALGKPLHDANAYLQYMPYFLGDLKDANKKPRAE